MPACCSTFECAADHQFNEKKATEELKRYRTKGPGPTTRLIQQGLEQAGTLSGTLLDIGSGIGSLTFGLLERGVTHAVAVDASSAYNGVRAKRQHVWAEQTQCVLSMPTLYLSRPSCLWQHLSHSTASCVVIRPVKRS
jgi:SAM-dependent methyltransferase